MARQPEDWPAIAGRGQFVQEHQEEPLGARGIQILSSEPFEDGRYEIRTSENGRFERHRAAEAFRHKDASACNRPRGDHVMWDMRRHPAWLPRTDDPSSGTPDDRARTRVEEEELPFRVVVTAVIALMRQPPKTAARDFQPLRIRSWNGIMSGMREGDVYIQGGVTGRIASILDETVYDDRRRSLRAHHAASPAVAAASANIKAPSAEAHPCLRHSIGGARALTLAVARHLRPS